MVALAAEINSLRRQLQDQASKARVAHHQIRSAAQYEHRQILIGCPAQRPDRILARRHLAKETRRPAQLESGQRRQGNVLRNDRRQAS